MSKWPYATARWKRLRAAHLALEPACRGCKRMGRLTLANTVDHVVAISEGGHAFRSEEHTSELQSLMRISYAVFCLKKQKKQNNYINIVHKYHVYTKIEHTQHTKTTN